MDEGTLHGHCYGHCFSETSFGCYCGKIQIRVPDLHQTFRKDFDVNLIMNTRLSYMDPGTRGCCGKKPALHKMKLPPELGASLTCIILSDV